LRERQAATRIVVATDAGSFASVASCFAATTVMLSEPTIFSSARLSRTVMPPLIPSAIALDAECDEDDRRDDAAPLQIPTQDLTP